MSIPKTVHTCWFGGKPKSQRIERYLATQRTKLPDYEFVEWTETTVDFDEFPFLRRAWETRQFAHLSDMVRLLVLLRHGGIYVDTDVEIVRSFDPLLEASFLAGYMWECMLGTAVFGAEPGHPVVDALLRPYREDWATLDLTQPNNHLVTRHFIDSVPGFRLNGREWRQDGIHILDRFGFEQPSLGKRRNYAIHHFTASWKSESRLKRRTKEIISRSGIGLYLYRQYICRKSHKNSAFRRDYDAARRAG